MIPFKRINLGNSLERIAPLIQSGMIGLGNEVFKFEKALAEYVGAKQAVAVDSCTSAIFLSLKWHLKTAKNRNISIPSMTVPLVACAAIEAGAYVTFDDRTDWVGRYYRLEGTDIIDSAHELRRDQYKIIKKTENPTADPLWMPKLCYSFYPTKTIGSADGGAIVTDDEAFADWAREISTYGRNQRRTYANSWDYDVVAIGYKRHYTNLQAAICMEQLGRLGDTNANRQAVVKRYNEAFGLANESDYLYRINVAGQDEFIHHMTENGIECGVHFKPLHLMQPYRRFKVSGSNAKKRIEEAYSKTVSLPLYDTLTDTEVDQIIDATLKSGRLIK